MIPIDYIREWQQYAPWPLLKQIEQDLVISRALVSLYQHPKIADTLAFRGGTALQYQRKKGRDLFDLWWVIKNNQIDLQKTVAVFERYLSHENKKVSRAQFEST